MLLPFDRTLFTIEQLSGRYIPSVLNDLFRVEKKLRGYALCVDEGHAGYVFFEEGRILDAVAHHFSPELALPLAIPFSHFLEERTVDIYINAIEDGNLLQALREHLVAHASVVANTELLSPVHIVNYAKKIRYNGLVTVRHGIVNNMLMFKNGEFDSLLYYHPDSHGFVRERSVPTFKEYIMAIADMSPLFIMHNGTPLKSNKSAVSKSVPLQKDILVNIMMCYFDFFNMAIEVMKESFSAAMTEKIIKKILSEVKKKYYPLYSAVHYDKTVGTVNWYAILNDRRYIPVAYRFEHYHLYFDELLTMLVAALISKRIPAAFELFKDRVDMYVKHLDERDWDLKRMISRVRKMIEKMERQQ